MEIGRIDPEALSLDLKAASFIMSPNNQLPFVNNLEEVLSDGTVPHGQSTFSRPSLTGYSKQRKIMHFH